MEEVGKSCRESIEVTCLSDKTLASNMIQAMAVSNNQDLYRLITSVRSGRRVFKQLCLKGDIPFSAFDTLEAKGETDLAFHVACSHSEWPSVIQLYENPEVRATTRALGFHKAAREASREVVVKMAEKDVCTTSQRRGAFYEAVRQGQLTTAFELTCTCNKSFSNNDRVFALQECQRLRKWEDAVDFTWTLSGAAVHANLKLMSRMVAGASEDGKLSSLLELAGDFSSLYEDRKFLDTVFREALKRSKTNFVFVFCRRCLSHEWRTRRRPLRVATDISVRTNKWNALRKLSKLHPFRLTEDQFEKTLTKSFRQEKTRDLCAPLLETILVKDVLAFNLKHVSTEVFKECRDGFGKENTQWCFTNEHYNLALLLSLASTCWTTTLDVVQRLGSKLNPGFLHSAFEVAFDYTKLDVAVGLLRHMELGAHNHNRISYLHCSPSKSRCLAEKCKENGMMYWTVFVAARSYNWDWVQEELKTCHDPTIVDFAVTVAARENQWEQVESLLHRCSETSPALGKPLALAVKKGQLEHAKVLIGKTDPRVEEDGVSLLQLAVRCESNREEMVKLCIEAGLSTHEAVRKLDTHPDPNPWITSSAILMALLTSELRIFKLLHDSGAASNCHLFELTSEQSLYIPDQIKQERENIIQCLEQAASTPRSLQGMCRLLVSHLIGCQPGREDRIRSLPVPHQAKQLVRFRDILDHKAP